MNREIAIKRSNLSPSELKLIEEYLGRSPTVEEIGMFGALWSEHCGYKNTKPLIKKLPTKGKHLLQGPGENAGVIRVGDYAVAFKIESHNHPSAVEPYQGAATGVGGILRDVFAMGARPVAVLDSLRFGKPDSPRTRYLVSGVIKGISDYGNRVGIPTVGGEVVFEDSYEGNPLVNVMCVGIAKPENIIKAIARGEGNLLFYYGSKTGRDGLGGATFASAELSSEGEDQRPSVQVGDAFTEKLILEATLELIEKKLIVGIQDMGAAGITSSSVEMAARGKSGIEIFIDKVPARAANMTAYEFLLSESQERMLACIEPEKLPEVEKIMQKWELDYAVIGKVTNTEHVVVYEKDKIVADIPIRYLVDDVPMYVREVIPPQYLEKAHEIPSFEIPRDFTAVLKNLLKDPSLASKRWVYKRYDHMVQTNLLAEPMEAGGALLRIKGTTIGLAMSTDGNGRYTYLDPYRGGMQAVAEATRNLSCMGAEPYGITNCLNFGNPEKSPVYYQIARAMEGMAKACETLEVPVTGGNASLYNETDGEAILPTLIVGAVGAIPDYRKAVFAPFQQIGHQIYLLGHPREGIGGSMFLKHLTGKIAGECPYLDIEEEKRLQLCIRKLIEKELIASAQDVSDGGLAFTLAECALLGNVGISIQVETEISPESFLFGEAQSRIVFSAAPEKSQDIKKVCQEYNLPLLLLGETTLERNIMIRYTTKEISLSVEEARNLYMTEYL
ncbi:phosphoribosylformylglycinamidine synthase subunit PurL [Thermospira aquatica]|uniref:Phosphoribosylformylglycinamidine synthase subunit PurL n=1 Tax=Thermospira aquatica TaxID=2828656 RepID=A0AAX3BCP7_9SPIR|nr:phosphoribosylformylglycinamidine synthase subunit PurL [Thermospira aquatica]URA09970.1 phosphoribosylformylglycinamidine synthase subunit PurL [Thermospira aquatica]